MLLDASREPELSSHWWWRPGWVMGRRIYTMHLTMEDSPEVLALAERLRPTIDAAPSLEPVPPEWLHLTMNGIGFTDEVSPARLEDVAGPIFEAWEAGGAHPLEFTGSFLAPAGFMLTSPIPPWLAEANRIQRRSVERVLGPRGWGDFEPHVTLAYANDRADLQEVATGLRTAIASEAPRISVRPVFTLMSLGRDREVYEWEVVRRSPSPPE